MRATGSFGTTTVSPLFLLLVRSHRASRPSENVRRIIAISSDNSKIGVKHYVGNQG